MSNSARRLIISTFHQLRRMENNLSRQLEAVLFYYGEPVTVRRLSAITKTTEEAIQTALCALKDSLAGRGVCMITKEDRVMLATAPECAALITAIAKEELEMPLSKVSLETLAIILYRHPVAKSEIDYIRGVNSGFILRSLLVRGLIERNAHPVDRRMYVYMPSFALLRFLGVEELQKLPGYEAHRNALENFFAPSGDESSGAKNGEGKNILQKPDKNLVFHKKDKKKQMESAGQDELDKKRNNSDNTHP